MVEQSSGKKAFQKFQKNRKKIENTFSKNKKFLNL